MNQKLNKQLHTLLTLRGLQDQKTALVSGVTEGRTESSKDMTDDEARKLIEAIKPVEAVSAANSDAAKKTQRLRKCFSLFRQIGYYKGEKPDYDHINNFCLTKSAAKKKLTEMDKTELSKLIYQLTKIVKQ